MSWYNETIQTKKIQEYILPNLKNQADGEKIIKRLSQEPGFFKAELDTARKKLIVYSTLEAPIINIPLILNKLGFQVVYNEVNGTEKTTDKPRKKGGG
ncbi:hypothetical protein RDV78_04230 [Bacillota bacterium LX-D]|nr:hypothetical protein [Bacillota bacterium LX-D]